VSGWVWLGLAIAGSCGALGRYHLTRLVTGLSSRRRIGGSFPAGTFVVNLTGAFLLGLLTGLEPTGTVAFIVGTGLLGAYTTFSTWMVETVGLAKVPHRRLIGTAYLLGSAVVGLALAAAGFALGTALGTV
jgi:CrcB protein